jgi:Xaa-Pro aminopeptidase
LPTPRFRNSAKRTFPRFHCFQFEGIADALAEAISKVRPGVRVCDLDAEMRRHVLRLRGGYPHHSGHGLGVSWQEEPRIVPYNTIALQPGMVLEPGILLPGAVRVETGAYRPSDRARRRGVSKFERAL